MSHFKETLKKEIIPKLQEELNIKNRLALPRLEKLVVNSGIGRIARDQKSLDNVSQALCLITGQKPIITKARKAISSFKVRQGMPVGLKVALRDKRMYDFIEKLIKVVLPRMRDFDGINLKSLDERGNLTIGFKEASAFPEISRRQKVEYVFGLEISIVTHAKTKKEALLLFKKIGFIFKEGN